MATRWVALVPIKQNGVLAYPAGDTVPDANVALYGYDAQGLVQQVTVPDPGGTPVDPFDARTAVLLGDPTTLTGAAGRAAFLTPLATDPGGRWVLSNSLRDLTPVTGPAARTPIPASLGWESTVVQEPSVWFADGLYHCIYTGGSSNAHRLGYMSAPHPLGPWTKNPTPVIGGGAGGYSGGAFHSNTFRDGTNLYCYFTDDQDPTVLRVATASTTSPTVWTLNARTYVLPAGSNQWGNTFVLKEPDGTYTMFLETSTSAASWQLGLGTLGSSPVGPLTISNATLPTLRPSAPNATATVSAGWVRREDDGTYVMYFHAGPTGSIPTDIYRATSTDKITWVVDNGKLPIIRRQSAAEIDQVADPFLIQHEEAWYLFCEGYDNKKPASTLEVIPLAPTLKVRQGSSWTRMPVSDPNASSQVPGKPVTSELTTDKAVTSTGTNWTDLLDVQPFTPTGTALTLRISGSGSVASAGNNVRLRAVTGSITRQMGSITGPNGGYQFPISGEVRIEGLTPGQPYSFKIQASVSGGTFNCRPASFPEFERLTATVADSSFSL